MQLTKDMERLCEDFLHVAELEGADRGSIHLNLEPLPAPHTPPASLPRGCMAVYVFCHKGQTLKVGRAGPNSGPRYTSHHYNLSAPSTLAKSLLKDGPSSGIKGLSEANISEWIKKNTDRFNFIIKASSGPRVLALLEAFLQCRLQPLFEGPASQR